MGTFKPMTIDTQSDYHKVVENTVATNKNIHEIVVEKIILDTRVLYLHDTSRRRLPTSTT